MAKVATPTRDELIAENARLYEEALVSHNSVRDGGTRIKALEEEVNTLRDAAMDATLRAERAEGYIAAMRDLEPPRMVPEIRTQGFERAPEYRPIGSRRWYHR